MPTVEQLADFERGERLWRVTYDCDHTMLVSTFIGDFDYWEVHQGPAVCFRCKTVEHKDE